MEASTTFAAARAFAAGLFWIVSPSMLAGLMPPQARAQGTIDLPAANRTAGAANEASGWPAKPVRLVVPLPAGGDVDGFAAPLAAALSKELGQPVVLDHRPGVGGNLGAEIVAKSAADGYTFLLGSVDQAIAAASAAGLSYDLQQDLAPVTLLAAAPVAVVVDATRPAMGAIADLVRVQQAHRARPAASYASTGDSSLSHLAAARFHQATGGGTGHRAIRGAATALADLQAGHADYLVAPLNAVLPAIREGRVRALAVSGAARSFSLPAVPTLAEAGIGGLPILAWYALWSPTGTPATINQAMQRGVAAVLDQQRLVDIWNRLGAERGGQAADVLALMVHSEVLNWREAIRTLDRADAADAANAARSKR